MNRIRKSTKTLAVRAQFFSGAEEDAAEAFALPEDISALSSEELVALRAQAAAEFDTLYGDGSALSTDSLEALGVLTEAIEALSTQIETLASIQSDAAALAARRASFSTEEPAPEVEDDEDDAEDEGDDEGGELSVEEPEGKFAQKTEVRLKARGGQAARQAAAAAAAMAQKKDMKDVVFAVGENLGVAKGAGMDFDSLGVALDHRLKSFNLTAYQSAASTGRDVRDLQSFATIKLPIADELVVKSNDRAHISQVIAAATKADTPALLASGGWHAASEVLYNQFLGLETNEGMLSVPEIGISRGGAQINQETSFAEIYAAVGFSYTEAQDIAGEYDTDSGGPIAGPKPVYKVGAPTFEEYRLGISGLIIEAGLLGYRGYPEHFADVIRKALVAHAHKLNAEFIADVVTGSTAVTMPTTQAGAAAPILSAVELQAEHLRATHRMSLGATLECKLPQWILGVIRTDLSRREGVDLISVTDARIRSWFTDRNIAVEFVYDWQPIETTAAGSFTAWPSTVSFLLYPAGTWVKGRSEVLTIDTLYDSTLLQNNDFTALFTEEGWFAAKVGTDSRVVTTGLVASGAAKLGVAIKHDGTV